MQKSEISKFCTSDEPWLENVSHSILNDGDGVMTEEEKLTWRVIIIIIKSLIHEKNSKEMNV
jgi:hypothetical protein